MARGVPAGPLEDVFAAQLVNPTCALVNRLADTDEVVVLGQDPTPHAGGRTH
jgi:hypothetical protein